MARGITFTINDTAVRKRLSTMASGIKDFREPFNKAQKRLMPYFQEAVFESQGAVLGESWRALAASTLRARAARSGYYRAPPIATNMTLVWTGRLQKGFKSTTKRDSLRIFNPVPYFKYHQRGQRKMLAINKDVILITISEVERYAHKLLTR